MTEIGHNSVAKDQLKSIIERVENVQQEIDGLASDKRDILTEAKSNGYDVKAIREILRLRKQDADKRREHEAMVDTYRSALGME
jgi:uncharacterized protein (UPF0335 family)